MGLLMLSRAVGRHRAMRREFDGLPGSLNEPALDLLAALEDAQG